MLGSPVTSVLQNLVKMWYSYFNDILERLLQANHHTSHETLFIGLGCFQHFLLPSWSFILILFPDPSCTFNLGFSTQLDYHTRGFKNMS